MEITTVSLMFYFAAWTLFYALLSKYIARLSKDEWVKWAKIRESDEELIIHKPRPSSARRSAVSLV